MHLENGYMLTSTSFGNQAVFCHAPYAPSKLLVVPAKPMIPSSKVAYPSIVLGTVRSHRSEISWRLTTCCCLLFAVS